MYFLYPETSGVRLEDMDQLFGDATTAHPTPATHGERGSLMGVGSPVPSLDIRRGGSDAHHHGSDYAIPGLDIDPPTPTGAKDDKVDDAERGEMRGRSASTPREGIGGWISNMVGRGRDARNRSEHGQYRRLEDGDQDEE